MNLLRRKSVTALQAEALTDQSLKRALGPVNLTALGVGAIGLLACAWRRRKRAG
jgi:APA family basic amino acid/polyamine antiporter